MSDEVLFAVYGFLLVALVVIVRSEFARSRKATSHKPAYVDGWSLARNGWPDKR
jgi:hypothetical protein